MTYDLTTAQLPATYEQACHALAVCSRVDECQEWADKAKAMASYARQADDETLHRYADRIKARAIRRGGELLKQIPPATGNNLPNVERDATVPYGRIAAADAAGISERQRKTMLRVANVPEGDFERQVESDNPPTLTELADQGKRPAEYLGDSSPANFRSATQALALLRRFAEFTAETDPIHAARGVRPREIPAARERIAAIDAWLDSFVVSLGGSQ
jgi:hypothetical protein